MARVLAIRTAWHPEANGMSEYMAGLRPIVAASVRSSQYGLLTWNSAARPKEHKLAKQRWRGPPRIAAPRQSTSKGVEATHAARSTAGACPRADNEGPTKPCKACVSTVLQSHGKPHAGTDARSGVRLQSSRCTTFRPGSTKPGTRGAGA